MLPAVVPYSVATLNANVVRAVACVPEGLVNKMSLFKKTETPSQQRISNQIKQQKAQEEATKKLQKRQAEPRRPKDKLTNKRR